MRPVLGGEMAAGDDDVAPWLPATRSSLARAVDGDVPVLGRDDDLVGPLARGGGGSWLTAQAHDDAITALPEGGVLLASSTSHRVQVFRAGRCAWDVQHHPEVSGPQLDRWLGDRGAALAARGTDREEQRDLVVEHEGHLAEHHGRHLRVGVRDAQACWVGSGGAAAVSTA